MKGALVLVLPLFVACSTVAESCGSDASQLEHASEALLDAVTSGDKAVFARTLDPEASSQTKMATCARARQSLRKCVACRQAIPEICGWLIRTFAFAATWVS